MHNQYSSPGIYMIDLAVVIVVVVVMLVVVVGPVDDGGRLPSGRVTT
jgi:hypothetical protein